MSLSLSLSRRAEDNALDLNNFPDDFQPKEVEVEVEGVVVEGGLSSDGGDYRKKKKEKKKQKEGEGEKGKVYECRFCTLKFGKSQALGGHMNRHRQERETETLNRARQLVFGNDALPPPPNRPPHHHLGYHHPGSHVVDPILAFRPPSSSLYTPPPGRFFSGPSSASSSSAFLQPYLYQSPYTASSSSSSSQFTSSHDFSLRNQVLNRPNQYMGMGPSESSTNYTCVGAPVRDAEGTPVWGTRMGPHRNNSSEINRFRDGL